MALFENLRRDIGYHNKGLNTKERRAMRLADNAQQGNLHAVRLGIARGADPEAKLPMEKIGGPFAKTDTDVRALHVAAAIGVSADALQIMARMSRNPDAPMGNGMTPIAIAARQGSKSAILGLAAGGADVDAKVQGLTLQEHAKQGGSEDNLAYLSANIDELRALRNGSNPARFQKAKEVALAPATTPESRSTIAPEQAPKAEAPRVPVSALTPTPAARAQRSAEDRLGRCTEIAQKQVDADAARAMQRRATQQRGGDAR